jgi:hypothetical protein
MIPSVTDPVIRSQLAAHYREWNRIRTGGRPLRKDLKCNGCKQRFRREIMTRVYPSIGRRQWVSYCPECLKKRDERVK